MFVETFLAALEVWPCPPLLVPCTYLFIYVRICTYVRISIYIWVSIILAEFVFILELVFVQYLL